MEQSSGLVHIYCGDGKGKTTAAIGAAVRAVGNRFRVLFVQFLKGSSTGELEPLKKLGVDVLRTETVKNFLNKMSPNELEVCRIDHLKTFNEALLRFSSQKYDMVILDEVIDAINKNLIDERRLIDIITASYQIPELILTGRNPSPALISMSDYVSEITEVKHPFKQGIIARKGIEY